jgi:two-component system, OmpR family, sensor histidine kinase MtrB
VRTAQLSTRHWQAAANIIGIGVGILLLIGFAFAVAGTNVLLERPLLAITRAIARFAGGDESARTVPAGPRELRQMATTFNDLADRLVRQDRERLTFLGGVAHDLRNPLSVLKMATDAVRRGELPGSPEKIAQILAIVGRQIDHLDRMVGDLLDSTRIESGRLELRPELLDLRSIASCIVDLYRHVSPTHELVCVEPNDAVVAECDSTRIAQVITNLVSNAIKYSPDGGRVTVTTSTEGLAAVISVSDEGVGVPLEDHERIFEPFHRCQRSQELAPGVGLGLSVARKIVAAHGGTLELESRRGAGSTFQIILPLAAASRISPSPSRHAKGAGAATRSTSDRRTGP